MELSEEFVKENGLSEDQVKSISDFGASHVADIKKQYDEDYSGTANENAEKILGGAASKVQDLTKVERQQGEKLADYYDRAWNEFNQTKLSEIDTLKNDYTEKVKNFKGSDDVKNSLNELKTKYDALQSKEAQFDELINSGVNEKYEKLNADYLGMERKTAFNAEKPSFPDTVNKFELTAKWNDFENRISEEFDVKIVEGESLAISKENKHKQFKLSELVAKDSEIQSMLEGRQQKGLDGKPKDLMKVEGVPFEVPKNADSQTRAKLIREHLAKENISTTDPRYAAKFSELNTKLRSVA